LAYVYHVRITKDSRGWNVGGFLLQSKGNIQKLGGEDMMGVVNGSIIEKSK
jgi:hypothetical protein